MGTGDLQKAGDGDYCHWLVLSTTHKGRSKYFPIGIAECSLWVFHSTRVRLVRPLVFGDLVSKCAEIKGKQIKSKMGEL